MRKPIFKTVQITMPEGAGVALFGVQARDQAECDERMTALAGAFPEDATIRAADVPTLAARRRARFLRRMEELEAEGKI